MKFGIQEKKSVILMAAVFLATVCLGQFSTLKCHDMGDLSSFAKWHEIEISFT